MATASAKAHSLKPIAQMSRVEIIDELGPLEEKYEAAKPWLDRRDALRDVVRGGGPKKLVGWAESDKKPVAAAVQYDGARYQVQLSECANQGTIPGILNIFKRVGQLWFIQHAKISLTDLREKIPSADEEGLIVTEQTGPRKITAVVSKKAAA